MEVTNLEISEWNVSDSRFPNKFFQITITREYYASKRSEEYTVWFNPTWQDIDGTITKNK
jgi:hypothetical protein